MTISNRIVSPTRAAIGSMLTSWTMMSTLGPLPSPPSMLLLRNRGPASSISAPAIRTTIETTVTTNPHLRSADPPRLQDICICNTSA